MSQINSQKVELFLVIDMYLNDKESFDQLVVYEESWADEFADSKIAFTFLEGIDQHGADAMLQAASQFINDDADRRSIIEFLRSLTN